MKQYVVFDMIGVIFKSEMMTDVLYSIMPHTITKKRLKNLYHQFEIGKIDSKAFWDGLRIKNHRTVEKEFLDNTQLDDNLLPVARILKKKYCLGILSNMPKEWGRYFIRKYKLATIFDEIILSGEVKAKKPSKKIYEIAVRKFGEFIFIDDRLENLKAARRFGIKTVLMERKDPTRKFKPDYTIHSLLELKGILLKGEDASHW